MSDFIYMQRMRNDLTVFSPEVSKNVFNGDDEQFNDDSPSILDIKERLERHLIPLEMRVSKSKEKGKGYSRFMLFCNQNLRLYNNVKEYFDDLEELKRNSNIIIRKIDKIKQLSSVNSSMLKEKLEGIDIVSSDENIEEAWTTDPF